VWLDVYHFPLEAWLEDLKQAEAHSQVMTFDRRTVITLYSTLMLV